MKGVPDKQRTARFVCAVAAVFPNGALSLGHSGVQVITVQRIIDFFNNDVMPIVYAFVDFVNVLIFSWT